VKAGDRIAKLDDRHCACREEIQSDVARAKRSGLAQTQLARLDKLATSNAIAKTQLDEAKATLETNAQMLAHARAQLHQIDHDIDQADVRAPFNGVVTERFAQRGEYLQVGATIVHLVDTSRIEARVQAPLALADKIHARPGQSTQSNPVRMDVIPPQVARQHLLLRGHPPIRAAHRERDPRERSCFSLRGQKPLVQLQELTGSLERRYAAVTADSF
jgi:RND family efflux transporter MFP subunit